MSYDLNTLEEAYQKLEILHKLCRDRELNHAERQKIFDAVVERFHAGCIGLYELRSHDALHPDQLRYRQEEGGRVPDYTETQLKHHMNFMLRKVATFLPDMLYEALASIFTILKNMDLSVFSESDRQKYHHIKIEFSEIAKIALNRRKQLLHDQLLTALTNQKDLANRNFLLRQSIQIQGDMIDQWQDFLRPDNQSINLMNLDLSGMDLSNLSIRSVEWNERTCIMGMRLAHVEVNPEQFLYVHGLQSVVNMDPELLSQVRAQKALFIQAKMRKIREKLIEFRASLEAWRLVGRVVCQGTLPDLEDLDDDVLKAVITRVLIGYFINTLPATDPANQEAISKNPDLILKATREEALDALYRLIRHKDMRLTEEAVTFTQSQKMALIFEQISDLRETLELLEKIIEDSSEAEVQKPQLAQCLQDFRELKAMKSALQIECDQKSIDALLEALFDEPDEMLKTDPPRRIETALSVAAGRDDLVVDLRPYDLSRIRFTPRTDFSDVHVKLTSDQERQLSDLHHRQHYARLYRAIQKGDQKEIAICLEQGLDVNYQERWTHRTPFMEACFSDQPELIRFLLQHHADINLRASETRMSIIEAAARARHGAVVEVLRQHVLQADLPDPLDFVSAVYLGDLASCQALATAGPLPSEDPYTHDGLLHIAIRHSYHDLLTWLIQQGLAVNQANNHQVTPLELACELGDQRAANILLEGGATLTKQALRKACEHQHQELALFLRPRLTEIDLYSAVFLEEMDTVKQLIEDRYDDILEDGYTPLTLACHLGCLPLAQWLLENGANPYIPAHGSTPMRHAIDADQVTLVKYLLEQGVSAHAVISGIEAPFITTVVKNHPQIVEVILNHYRAQNLPLAMINAVYEHLGSRTPLLIAAYDGFTEVVELLLEAGADVFAKDLIGNLPIHLAAERGHHDIVGMLSRAMLQVKNDAGRTPEEVARAKKQESIVTLLSFRGVNLLEDWYDFDTQIFPLLRHCVDLYNQNYEASKQVFLAQLPLIVREDNIHDVIQALRNFEQARPVADRIIYPVHLDGNHWTFLWIKFEGNAASPHVAYVDPTGESLPKTLREGVQEVFPGAHLVHSTERLQYDGYNCGPWIVECIQSLLNHDALPQDLTESDLQKIRRQHQNILREASSSRSSPSLLSVAGTWEKPRAENQASGSQSAPR